MLDLKFVRENPDIVKQNIKNKFQDRKLPLVDEVIELDKRNREIKGEVEALRAEKNKVSKEIGACMAHGEKEKAEELGYEVKCASHDDDAATQLELFEAAINDGAAAIVVMSEEKAKELGVKPMATFVAGALGGVDPKIMGIGPVASTKKVLAKTGMSIDDFDLIEANEAFAAQSVAVGRELGFDLSKLNVNGGAIALGHPVGASGCRILVTLLHEMQKRGSNRGLATLCIGGGMGCSTIVEKY